MNVKLDLMSQAALLESARNYAYRTYAETVFAGIISEVAHNRGQPLFNS